MPSWQSYALRGLLRAYIAPKFRRAGISVTGHRQAMACMARFARVPSWAQVQPVDARGVAADWVQGPDADPQRVVLYVHGGGCVMGSPATHRELSARIARAAGGRALVPDYRLAPEHPYPAALQDVLAVYRWLLASGVSPRTIAMGGDSAGGGLTLQALLSLRDAGEPLPAAAILLSPLADWVRFDGESYQSRAARDPWLSPELVRVTASYFVVDADRDDPLLSPVHADLSGLPPLLVQVGDDEVLLSDALRVATRARRAGGPVELSVWPAVWHVFQASGAKLPEAGRAITELGIFLRRHLAA